jgi:cytochrome c oxidase subunit 1
MLGLNGLSAICAALGGLMFIVIAVASVFFGKPVGATPAAAPKPAPRPPVGPVGAYGSAGTLHIPGTVVLVGVFFVAFVLYYFVNWKYLAEIWPLR